MLFVLLMAMGAVMAQVPKSYQKNSHVKFSTWKEKGLYRVQYVFKDQFGAPRKVDMDFPDTQTEKMVGKFGIPREMLGPYPVTPEVINARVAILKEGMFSQGRVITVDLSAVTSYYRPFCAQIAQQLKSFLQEAGRDDRKNRIEMAMKFVQDIPYGIPESQKNDWYNGGLLTPPEVLIYNYGDCDSKSVLFAGILSFLIEPEDVIFLRSPSHVLTAVHGQPEPGQYYIVNDADSKKYILAETAGPGRVKLGDPGSNYDANTEYRIETLNINAESGAEWRAGDRGYYFMVNGETVTDRLHNSWVGDDLIVYDTKTGSNYLLEGFRARRDMTNRPARFLVGPAFWMRKGNQYFFYIKGQSIGHRTESEWKGQDLVVKDPDTGWTYRLPNFSRAAEGKVQVALLTE